MASRVIISMVSVLSLCTQNAVGNSYQWHTEFVDINNNGGVHTSIALDSFGNPHIAHKDGLNNDLRYATKSENTWINSIIDASGDVGFYPSIKIDTNNNSHVSYLDATNGDLKYAKLIQGLWNVEVVQSASRVGWDTSLAFDSNDKPHISYRTRISPWHLRYASKTTASWNIQDLGRTNTSGGFTSLAFDSNDNPTIVYPSSSAGLKATIWNGASWETEVIDNERFAGAYPSLAIDMNDVPHISYRTNDDALRYATHNGTGWLIQTIDNSIEVGAPTSLALDAFGNPHISYSDRTNMSLKHAYWNGNIWTTETVDNGGNIGNASSMAIDQFNNIHISYSDLDNGKLKYAFGVIPEPPIEISNIRFTPQALNPGGKGNWVKAHFQFINEYSIEDFDPNSTATIDPFGIVSEETTISQIDPNTIEVVFSFDRQEFCNSIGSIIEGERVEVKVVSQFTTEQEFFGTDTIKVVLNRLEHLLALSSRWLESDCDKPDWCGGLDLDQNATLNIIDYGLFDGCYIEIGE